MIDLSVVPIVIPSGYGLSREDVEFIFYILLLSSAFGGWSMFFNFIFNKICSFVKSRKNKKSCSDDKEVMNNGNLL